MGRAVVGVAVAGLVALGLVLVLRNATMTVHTKMPRDSTLVVDGSARSRARAARVETLARALVNQCVAETAPAAVVDRFRWADDQRFTVHVVPALDEFDRRQLDGCLSDLRMPRLIVSVEQMHVVRSP